MKKEVIPYKRLVLICTNLKSDETKPCCGRRNGEAIFLKIKEAVRERNLGDVVRISKTGCLGKCAYGPNIMVYPEGIWYSDVKLEEVEYIITDIISAVE